MEGETETPGRFFRAKKSQPRGPVCVPTRSEKGLTIGIKTRKSFSGKINKPGISHKEPRKLLTANHKGMKCLF